MNNIAIQKEIDRLKKEQVIRSSRQLWRELTFLWMLQLMNDAELPKNWVKSTWVT